MDNVQRNAQLSGDLVKEVIPFAPLGFISMSGTEELGKKIDAYMVKWRKERGFQNDSSIFFREYEKDSFILDAECVRFGSGEGKGVFNASTRGMDLYFLVDVTNYSVTYRVGDNINHYSPDDHYQDLKRLIAASAGHARRITVIMPFLYEGRINNRDGRQSLDCAQMLKELVSMGVSRVITFDANDPRVQNAIPYAEFETISPTYQYIKALCREYDDLKFDSGNMVAVSPDEHGMRRAVYLASVLGTDMGMFYLRKDYSVRVNGANPVIANEFLGPDVRGKDVIVVDDIISSGYKMLTVSRELKRRGAKRVFPCVSFGLFTRGFEQFDKAYEEGCIDKVFTTNLIYRPQELIEREWYAGVDMSKYIALIIDSLNHDFSMSQFLDPVDRINKKLKEYDARTGAK